MNLSNQEIKSKIKSIIIKNNLFNCNFDNTFKIIKQELNLSNCKDIYIMIQIALFYQRNKELYMLLGNGNELIDEFGNIKGTLL